jgi:hypothetical protein
VPRRPAARDPGGRPAARRHAAQPGLRRLDPLPARWLRAGPVALLDLDRARPPARRRLARARARCAVAPSTCSSPSRGARV